MDEVLGACEVRRGPGQSPGEQEHLEDSQKKRIWKGDRGVFRGVGGKSGDLQAQDSKKECSQQEEGGQWLQMLLKGTIRWGWRNTHGL